ncbi:MAG: HU family DNA-binding protein [Oscillospiraceae bacterium]
MKEINEMEVKTDLYYRGRYLVEKFGITQYLAEDILKSDAENITYMLLGGQDVRITGLGTFKIKNVVGTKEHYGIVNVATREMGTCAAILPHSKISFSITSPIKARLKELTYGKPFER